MAPSSSKFNRNKQTKRAFRMKILVMIKQVPDTATQVKIAADGRAIDTTGITWIVSPYDEFALEEALRIKEKRGQGEVVAVSLGPDRGKEALRSCLAMGADRAIHLNDPAWAEADTLTTARALAGVIKQEAPGLALFGRQAIDDDMGAVAAQVAEVLGWPCASWIMEEAVDEGGKTIRVGRQVEGGLEIFDLPLPAVASAQKGLNEPRYPTLKGIMGAKKKEIKDVKAADLGLAAEPPALSVVKLESLPPRPPGRIIQGEPAAAAKELVRALREDSKAI
jgi:electron transfer flavoprotein beta subunit